MKKNVLRVLQIVPNMQAGGLENLIMNLYRNVDREQVQFDFLVHYSKPNFFDEEIRKMGGKIHYFSFREDKNIFKYLIQLYRLYKSGSYKIVHSHMASLAFLHLGVAAICRIPVRILHSHNSSSSRTLKGRVKGFLLKLAPIFANNNFACSESAGKFLYGKKNFYVVNNAIDLNRFCFCKENRDSIRREFEISAETFVVGHIGRFNVQKNHMFLIDIFFEVLKQRKDAKLLLVGDGELRPDIESKITSLGIEKNVVLTGVRKDVDCFYSAFDAFVLPSLFEGLPVTGVEAQACGLPSFFSTEVTREVGLLPSTKFISLSETTYLWAKTIIDGCQNRVDSVIASSLSSYDIVKESAKLDEKYHDLLKETLT